MKNSFEYSSVPPSAEQEDRFPDKIERAAYELLTESGKYLSGYEGSAANKISVYLRDNPSIDAKQKELLLSVREQLRIFSENVPSHVRAILGMSEFDFEDFQDDVAIEHLENHPLKK